MSNFQKLVRPFVNTSTHRVTPFDLDDVMYYVFLIDGYVVADNTLKGTLTIINPKYRVDINGQSITEDDYIIQNYNGSGVLVKFIKANFPFILDNTDDIRVTGMFKHIPK